MRCWASALMSLSMCGFPKSGMPQSIAVGAKRNASRIADAGSETPRQFEIKTEFHIAIGAPPHSMLQRDLQRVVVAEPAVSSPGASSLQGAVGVAPTCALAAIGPNVT